MTHIISTIVPVLSPLILAQGATPTPETQPTQPGGGLFQQGFTDGLLNLGVAILTLVVGWIIALIAAALTRSLLKRTSVDNKIAGWVTGREGEQAPQVEKWISSVVFWVIFLFAVVAFLQTLQLTAVSQPLNALLEQITRFLPKLGAAAILSGVAWLLATLVKLLVLRVLHAFRIDERLSQQTGETPTETPTEPNQNQFSLSETVANTLYWFIFLLFLPSILSTLELEGTLRPVQDLLNRILAILPNILAAVLIGFAGWLIAQVVRRIVTNLLAATGTDRIGERFGLSPMAGRQSLSWIIGTIVFVLILIPTVIAALEALQIEGISEPAIAMLNQILTILPNIFTAALILVLAYVAGKYISQLVTNVLAGIGFNSVFQWMGLPTTRRTVPQSPLAEPTPETGQPTTIQPTAPMPRNTPSEMVGIIVLVTIMLFATLAAVNILGIEALTNLVNGIVVISGRVLVGLIVFAVGLYLANLAFNLITNSGTRQSRILGQTARIAIIALAIAMGLEQMGVASDIVNLAFGLLLGAIAVAIALAFGLGSRDIAAGQVREWLDSFKRDR